MLILSIWAIPVVIFTLFAIRQRSRNQKEMDSVGRSVDIHKARLDDLSSQFERGQLSEDEYHSFKLEEEKALLADTSIHRKSESNAPLLSWIWVPVISVFVIGVAFVTYNKVGSYDAVEVREQFRQLATRNDLDDQEITATLDGYRKLLESKPEDIEGWFRLSRMQSDMGLFEDSIDSLQSVLAQLRTVEHNAEDEATVLAYIGQSYVGLSQAEPALAAFEESLEYFQNNTALGMAGRMSFELGDYKKSIDYWTRLKLNNQDTDSKIIDDFIDKAKAELSAQGIDYEIDQPTRIIVNVELPAAWEGLSDDAMLFVYARPVGQRMPLAVKRLAIVSRSMSVLLSDADAMGPMGGISSQEIVEVTARVSLTGLANTQPGDWAGDSIEVALDKKESIVNVKVALP